MNDSTPNKDRSIDSDCSAEPLTRIPHTAQARLLLHDLEVNSSFANLLREALPDEAARLAYLNHLAWQSRS